MVVKKINKERQDISVFFYLTFNISDDMYSNFSPGFWIYNSGTAVYRVKPLFSWTFPYRHSMFLATGKNRRIW